MVEKTNIYYYKYTKQTSRAERGTDEKILHHTFQNSADRTVLWEECCYFMSMRFSLLFCDCK